MSEVKKGNKYPFFSKTYIEEARQKIREAKKNIFDLTREK